MTRLDAETREYLRREIDRRKRGEIEALRDPAERWSKASIIEGIRSFEAMVGRPPRRSDFEQGDHPLPSARTAARFFGSIGAALDAAFPKYEVESEVEQATLFEVA